MAFNDRIFLIGPMGAGKSAVGKRLAALLGYEFQDSDAEVERRTGVDIGFIFDKEGEAGFRRREREAIDELSLLNRIVLATGGGAVLDADTRSRLGERGYVIYLETSVAQQLNRTRRARNRPLLEGDDPSVTLEALMRQREPLYQEIADHSVSTDGRRVEAVARDLHRHLQRLDDQTD